MSQSGRSRTTRGAWLSCNPSRASKQAVTWKRIWQLSVSLIVKPTASLGLGTFEPIILRGGGYISPAKALRFSYRSDAFDPIRLLVFAGLRCVQPVSGRSIPDPVLRPRPKGL